jgi:hypothetical protein
VRHRGREVGSEARRGANRTEEIRAIGVSAYARSGIELFVVKHIAHKLEPDAFAKA